MAYGTCKKCGREVTVGGDRCAICGEPLPLLRDPRPTLRLDPPPIRLSHTASEPPVTQSLAELSEAAVLRPSDQGLAKSAAQTDMAPSPDKPIPGSSPDDPKQMVPALVGDRPDSFDMKQLLAKPDRTTDAPGLTSCKAPTVEVPALSRPVFDTDIEGFDAVRLGRRRRLDSRSAYRRYHLNRVLPLVAIVTLGILGLILLGRHLTPPDEDPTLSSSELSPMVLLAGGSYTLGLSEDNKETVLQACFRLSDNPNHECRRSYLMDIGEYPARQADFAPFEIDRYEVSNVRYQQCAEAGACPVRNFDACQFHTHRGYQLHTPVPERMLLPEMPAICVTREEAEQFCRWAGGSLPSPDQWERAARGGDDRLAPWGTLWASNLMNWAETDMGGFPVVGLLDGYDLTASVDRFPDGSTPDEIYNMLGNAAEWVAASDLFLDGTRGGSYRNDLRDLRLTRQQPLRPTARRSDVGFRCIYGVEEGASNPSSSR